MDLILFDSIWTVVLMLVFLGIVLWAWSGKRKRSFDEAANLPFADDSIDQHSKGGHHDDQ